MERGSSIFFFLLITFISGIYNQAIRYGGISRSSLRIKRSTSQRKRLTISIGNWNRPIMLGKAIVTALLKISDGGAHICHTYAMLFCCSLQSASWFVRIFSVDKVMLRERSSRWVMIPAYGSAAEEEELKANGWEGGEEGAKVG